MPRMPLLALFGMVLLTALLVSSATFAADRGQSSPESVLKNAASLVDLGQSAQGGGIMLLARVHLQDGKKSVDGVYALAASQGRFRRVFRFPNFTETQVLNDGILYRQRSAEALPLLIWEMDKLVNFPKFLSRASDEQLTLLNPSGAQLNCVRVRHLYLETRICVDPSSNELNSVEEGYDISSLASMRQRFEFSEYSAFENKRYPRKLVFRGWGSGSVELQIEKLLRVATFPTDEFAAPAGAERSHYCEDAQTKGEVRPSTGNSIPIGRTDMEVDMYFQVSSNGGVRFAEVVYSSDPLHDKEVLDWFVGTHFPIHTCAGEPVPYETMIQLLSGH